ncbi:MAG: MBL fold metallo-hydrolase [Saprospiraceae bacterium]|nr:MBL fold metallo-hydrolase [Saprospiraceae bacterium]
MNRRSFVHHSAILTGLSLLPGQKALLKSLFPDEGNMTILRDNVGIYTERGGTIGWMIEGDSVVVVDTQFPDQARNLISQIKQRGGKSVDLLINTHHHGDHSGGNIAFQGMADRIVAHTNSKKNQEVSAKSRGNEESQLYPTELYDTEWSDQIGSETITLRYFGAAHTDGDSLIHFENANIVHMGDLLFNRRFPFIDKSAGASIRNWIDVLQQAQRTFDKDTLYIFGHSGAGYPVTGNKDDLQAMQNYLRSLLKYVKKQMKKGLSVEEITKITDQIPGAPEWTGRGVGRSISAAFEELSEQ